jgi:thiazole biosynthesis enzyme
MKLDDIKISRAIIEKFTAKLLEGLDCEVAIVGSGPAGLTAAYYLAKEGTRVIVFERKLSVGGGMWGGGMMFNEIVVQDEGKAILDELGIRTVPFEDGYHCADSVEAVSTLCSAASKAGATIFNLITAEDVLLTDNRVNGLVINWSAVELAGLHVDPLTVRAKYVIDATGHSAEIANILQRKGYKLKTPTGKIAGQMPMTAEIAERTTLENTKEIYPGVYAAGMCCNAVFGGPRMGPIFGGMFLSGRKVAELISEKL